MDEKSIEAIKDIANAELREKHPMMDSHFQGWEVVYILKAYCKWYMLLKKAEEEA